MNCKPNRNAVFVRYRGNPAARHMMGMVFTVRYVEFTNAALGPFWAVDEARMPAAMARELGLPLTTKIMSVADYSLQMLPDDPDAPEQEVTNKEIEHA